MRKHTSLRIWRQQHNRQKTGADWLVFSKWPGEMLKPVRFSFIILLFSAMAVLNACAQADTEASADYDETKKMVIDILKTDDGKKALQEVLSDESMKEKIIMDQQIVTETIQTTLTSDEGTKVWKKSFEDPKFVENVAKNMREEHAKLLKSLMKDPEYKALMIEVLKDPEMEKEVTDILKSKEYREHLKKVMTETFESPLFQAKIQDILLKAAAEMDEKSREEKKKEGEE